MEGRVGKEDLPESCFSNCDFGEFDSSANTTSGILELDVPEGVRVLLTILKKLFDQSMSGRKEAALSRGLDGSHQKCAPKVLHILKKYNFAHPSERAGDPVWILAHRKRARVMQILNAPSSSPDELLAAVRAL